MYINPSAYCEFEPTTATADVPKLMIIKQFLFVDKAYNRWDGLHPQCNDSDIVNFKRKLTRPAIVHIFGWNHTNDTLSVPLHLTSPTSWFQLYVIHCLTSCQSKFKVQLVWCSVCIFRTCTSKIIVQILCCLFLASLYSLNSWLTWNITITLCLSLVQIQYSNAILFIPLLHRSPTSWFQGYVNHSLT